MPYDMHVYVHGQMSKYTCMYIQTINYCRNVHRHAQLKVTEQPADDTY